MNNKAFARVNIEHYEHITTIDHCLLWSLEGVRQDAQLFGIQAFQQYYLDTVLLSVELMYIFFG